jgi:uncharacterized membrane protein YdfJ with MMPL/SSD domain
VFEWLARLATRHAWRVLLAWAAALAALAATLPHQDTGLTAAHVPEDGPPGIAGGSAAMGGLAAPILRWGVPDGFTGGSVAGVVVVLAVLMWLFRSPVAALLPVAVAGLSGFLAGALLPAAGLTTPPAVLVYGTAAASTTVLIHRHRERLRSGDGAAAAVRTTLDRVGGVVATSTAAWIVACGALLLGTRPAPLGPALAVTGAIELAVVLTLVPALLKVAGTGLFWPSRSWRRTPRLPIAGRAGAAISRNPGAWSAAAAGALIAMGAGGLVIAAASAGPPAPPGAVVLVAGVLVALVLALALRSLVPPVYLAAGGLMVAWAAGAASTGARLPVFMFALATAVSTALLVLARARETSVTGRGPRACAALAVKYAGPPALANLAVAGTLAGAAYGPAAGASVALGGCALALVLVPGLTAFLGRGAWWPEIAQPAQPAEPAQLALPAPPPQRALPAPPVPTRPNG